MKTIFRRALLLAAVLASISPFTPTGLSVQIPTKAWTITLEEPTGIYRRDNEVVTVKLNFATGEARAEQLRVLSPDGHEILSQIAVSEKHNDGSIKSAELLIPATLVPGERPEFQLTASGTEPGAVATGSPINAKLQGHQSLPLPVPYQAQTITARRIGVGRVELANDRFGVLVNLGLEKTEPALVAAFNKSAGEQRMLNLIDTSPDVTEPLAFGKQSSGFGTFLSDKLRSGAFDQVEILESGPLRARVRLSGAKLGANRESWEFTWLANSPVLHWRSSLESAEANSNYGFFFSSVSATPYEPFNKWMEGSEQTKFPDGWEVDNPPDHAIAPNDFGDLPGKHLVYYRREENYGAIGFYELDASLEWRGVGSRQFYATTKLAGNKRSSEIAIAFPNWNKTLTVLEARKEYRKFIQPILAVRSSQFTVRRSQQSQISNLESQIQQTRSAQELEQTAKERLLSFDLDGNWKLSWAEKSEGEKNGFYRADFDDSTWRAVQVPGTVHTQILESPKFYTREAEWISEKEWWYRRKFTVNPATKEKRLWLRFEATDYYADVYLNGELLGRHEGYIDPYEFDVTDKLRLDGENSLAVRVWTPVSYYWRHRPYTIKGSYGAVDQKPDNITPLGIVRPVKLIARAAVKIEDLAVDTRLNKDGSADVVLDLAFGRNGSDAENGTKTSVLLSLTPRNFTSATRVALQSTVALTAERQRFVLHVEKPELWWTWDHGKPNLYTLDVRVKVGDELSDQTSLAVGIREIEHIDWKFYLNGKRLFIRGTNFYYNLFQSEVRRADYERDFKLMLGLNINMIRLHCNFSNPEFYDLADESGVLIFQDFLEAAYPEDRDFSLKAARLYDPLIRYVRNHPSIALWATSDEESLENYRDLTKHLEPRLYALDPQRRPVQRSTGRYGDGHIYEGWYGGTIWAYANTNEKFISELGATALPNYDSVIKFLPNHWPIKGHADEWTFRKLQIPEAMRAWGSPEGMTLQEYIPQTQDYVARLFQLAIERMRRIKYNPSGGILHFHAIDLWPSVTMAAVDFYRQPTKAYFTVQRSFQMVLPTFAYDRDTWQSGDEVKTELWLVNDHWFAVPNTTVSWRVETATKQIVASGNALKKVTLEADSSIRLMDVNFKAAAPGKYSLWAKVVDERGQIISENNYEFTVKPK
ncbi:MAG: glycoside hydrolase family 2 TIM barrel-domain containing protein [Acidobacteriota bacterium]|nr:glycoside hydrolase family 2 TIM barrel-domain containing protein [Acidobacteriota bacterium]